MAKEKSKLSIEDKLKEILYLCDGAGKFTCGSFQPNRQNVISDSIRNLLKEYLKTSPENLLNCIEKVNEDKLFPRRSQLFRLLALALSLEEATDEVKAQIGATVTKIVKSDDDVTQFLKYSAIFRKKPGVKTPANKTTVKVLKKYYTSKSADDLVEMYRDHKVLHGWSHTDIIKICHLKSKTPQINSIINYILTNKESGSQDDKPFIDNLKKIDTLRKTTDFKVAVPLINELKASIEHVDTRMRKSAEVWVAALPNMTLTEVLKALPKLYKKGFLKKDAPAHSLINDMLVDTPKVKGSGLHPVEIFIHMKNFERGGRPMDVQLLHHLKQEQKFDDELLTKIKERPEIKAPIIMSNLQKCMNIACSNNISPLGKRYLLTVDTTDKLDNKCVGEKNITGIEAAAVFIWYLLRSEKDVTVAVFKEKDIEVIPLDRKGNLYDHVQKLRENKTFKFLTLPAPIEWAISQKKHVDIFINFIQCKEYHLAIPKDIRDKMISSAEAMHKYKRKVNLPNSKLINFCMSSSKMYTSNGTPNILDIGGLDVDVPKVIEAFCRGHFS